MVPLLRIRSSRRPGRTPTDQGRVVASSSAGRLACASLRQGLSEPRSGRWRTSSTSGPAPTTTCCCRRRRLRPAAARNIMYKQIMELYIGRVPGVYEEWKDCQKQVNNFSGNNYQGYESREVAEEKWRRHGRKKWRNFLVITTLLRRLCVLLQGRATSLEL